MKRPWLLTPVLFVLPIAGFYYVHWMNRVQFLQFFSHRQATLRAAASGLKQSCADFGSLPPTLADCERLGLLPRAGDAPEEPAWRFTNRIYRPTTCPATKLVVLIETYRGAIDEFNVVHSDGKVEGNRHLDRVLSDDDQRRRAFSIPDRRKGA